MRARLVEIKIILIRDNPADKAILVRADEDAIGVWLPRSAIEFEPSKARNCITVTMPEALAQEKGLV